MTKNPERTLIQLRAEAEWGEWLKRFAASEGRSAADLIALSVEAQAARQRFAKPPRRLVVRRRK